MSSSTMNSINDYTHFALDIKDENIIFTDYQEELRGGRRAKVYYGTLETPIKQCPTCHSAALVRNGSARVSIRYLAVDASRPVYLDLRKQRLRCQRCHATVMATTPLVERHCHISNAVKQKVRIELTRQLAMTEIAADTGASPNTVARELTAMPMPQTHLQQAGLPHNLAFDEFRGVGSHLHFICLNNDNHQIFQILAQRTRHTVTEYFSQFSPAERAQVHSVTIDLNYHYQEIIRQLFPNALIILDGFHLCQMATRAFNQLRAQTAKQFATNSREYRCLKFGWKQYLKASEQLSSRRYYDVHLHEWISPLEKVHRGLQADDCLQETYDVMQTITHALRHGDQERLAACLQVPHHVGPQMQGVLRSFRNNYQYIVNSTSSSYSNGALEGTIRKIKQLQRTAYGFCNYDHLVKRIMLMQATKKQKYAA